MTSTTWLPSPKRSCADRLTITTLGRRLCPVVRSTHVGFSDTSPNRRDRILGCAGTMCIQPTSRHALSALLSRTVLAVTGSLRRAQHNVAASRLRRGRAPYANSIQGQTGGMLAGIRAGWSKSTAPASRRARQTGVTQSGPRIRLRCVTTHSTTAPMNPLAYDVLCAHESAIKRA